MFLIIYNDKYTNIEYRGKIRRLYDELSTDSYTALYSETQIKLIEFIQNFNFKILYIKTSYKLKIPVTFEKPEHVDLNNSDVIKIKKLKKDDVYFLYLNQLFEAVYIIPKLTDQNYYYYDMLIVVNENFNINLIYNYNFNLINIESVSQINIIDLTYEWVEKMLNDRIIFNNQYYLNDKNYFENFFDIKKNLLPYNEFSKTYTGNLENKLEYYHIISSPTFYKNFDQNHYVSCCFLSLDLQILSFGRIYINKINSVGTQITHIDIYDMNSGFFTNFDELVGGFNVGYNNNKIIEAKEIIHTPSSLLDNINDQSIIFLDMNKDSVKTGFANFDNLKTYKQEELY